MVGLLGARAFLTFKVVVLLLWRHETSTDTWGGEGEFGEFGEFGEVRRGIDYDCTGNVIQRTAKTKRERKTKINREKRRSSLMPSERGD
jgi:hypothetical protein